MNQCLSLPDAARRLGISLRQLQRYAASGDIPTVSDVRGQRFVSEEWLNNPDMSPLALADCILEIRDGTIDQAYFSTKIGGMSRRMMDGDMVHNLLIGLPRQVVRLECCADPTLWTDDHAWQPLCTLVIQDGTIWEPNPDVAFEGENHGAPRSIRKILKDLEDCYVRFILLGRRDYERPSYDPHPLSKSSAYMAGGIAYFNGCASAEKALADNTTFVGNPSNPEDFTRGFLNMKALAKRLSWKLAWEDFVIACRNMRISICTGESLKTMTSPAPPAAPETPDPPPAP